LGALSALGLVVVVTIYQVIVVQVDAIRLLYQRILHQLCFLEYLVIKCKHKRAENVFELAFNRNTKISIKTDHLLLGDRAGSHHIF
jgi:hypothetical protein